MNQKGGERKVRRKKLPSEDLLKTGEMAKLAGVLSSTIRYYTEIGLIEPAATTPGGQRLYDKEDTLSRIRRIKNIERQRLPLEKIRKIIEDHRAKKL